MRAWVLAAVCLAACATTEPATPPEGAAEAAAIPSLGDILQASPASDWRPLDPQNTIYMDLPQGRVIIELSPQYTPNHAANITALARAHYYDGAYIVRSQDNYVVQWGRDESEPASVGEGHATIGAEFSRPRSGVSITRLVDPDSYAPVVGFAGGFPVAAEGNETWIAHCYGVVGAGRGDTADSGGGAELYVVIGQAPRHLDRNVTTVGRVIQGMEILSTMPRGTGPLGFYEQPSQRTPIRRVRVEADVPASERANLEVLRTDSATFRAVIDSRRTRRESWFLNPAGHINVCNVPLPVRMHPAG